MWNWSRRPAACKNTLLPCVTMSCWCRQRGLPMTDRAWSCSSRVPLPVKVCSGRRLDAIWPRVWDSTVHHTREQRQCPKFLIPHVNSSQQVSSAHVESVCSYCRLSGHSVMSWTPHVLSEPRKQPLASVPDGMSHPFRVSEQHLVLL